MRENFCDKIDFRFSGAGLKSRRNALLSFNPDSAAEIQLILSSRAPTRNILIARTFPFSQFTCLRMTNYFSQTIFCCCFFTRWERKIFTSWRDETSTRIQKIMLRFNVLDCWWCNVLCCELPMFTECLNSLCLCFSKLWLAKKANSTVSWRFHALKTLKNFNGFRSMRTCL